MRIRAFFIITALLAFPLQASRAPTAASPHCHLRARPRCPPIPLQTPSRRRNRPSGRQPSTRPAWIVSAPPESNLSRSRFLRLSTRNVPSRRPCGSRPSNCHRGGERRSAYPKSRRFPVSSANGSAIGCAISSLRSLPASSRSNSSRFTRDRVTNAAIATAQRPARSARTRPVWRRTSPASSSRMAKYCPSNRMGMNICVARSMPSASPHAGGSQRYSAQGPMRRMPSTCTSTSCNTGRATATAFVSDPSRPLFLCPKGHVCSCCGEMTLPIDGEGFSPLARAGTPMTPSRRGKNCQSHSVNFGRRNSLIINRSSQ